MSINTNGCARSSNGDISQDRYYEYNATVISMRLDIEKITFLPHGSMIINFADGTISNYDILHIHNL